MVGLPIRFGMCSYLVHAATLLPHRPSADIRWSRSARMGTGVVEADEIPRWAQEEPRRICRQPRDLILSVPPIAII